MIQFKAPLIKVGQLYLSSDHNEYIIVTKNNRGEIDYAGPGFRGRLEDQAFVARFQPVDPADVTAEELNVLLSFCPPGTRPEVGYIGDEELL